MIISGLVVLAFLIMHFYDFWVPEIKYKYIDYGPLDETRYFEELQHKFQNFWGSSRADILSASSVRRGASRSQAGGRDFLPSGADVRRFFFSVARKKMLILLISNLLILLRCCCSRACCGASSPWYRGHDACESPGACSGPRSGKL